MNRSPFVLSELYTSALEAVLGIQLDPPPRNPTKDPKWKELLAAVAELSHGLTLDRSKASRGAYLSNAHARRAYQLYYMTTNFFKLWPALRELSHADFFRSTVPLRHLDLGSGPGTGVWSVANWIQIECPTQAYEFTATDLLRTNLADARKFGEQLSKGLAHLRHGQYEPLDISDIAALNAFAKRSGKFKLITMMNALNEIEESKDAELLTTLLDLLESDGALIIVEPSSRAISRRALRFHDTALTLGATIFSPCTHSMNCPALKSETDWCHTEIEWQRPEFIKTIDDEVGTLRLSLKATYFTIRKSAGNIRDVFVQPGLVEARVVSERFDEKGRHRAFLCSERGREEFVMNKRDKVLGNRAFASTNRYDLVQIDQVESRGHDVKLTQQSTYVVDFDSSGARNVDK